VNAHAGNEHHGEDDGRCNWCEEPERQKNATAGLEEPRHQRVAAARMEAEDRHAPPGGFKPRPAEPAEQLLCPMRGQSQSDRESQKKQPDGCHLALVVY